MPGSPGGEALRLVVELRAAYRQATAVFRIQPALRMTWLKPSVEVGMVANQGRDRRRELAGSLGLTTRERLVYLYIGRYGQNDLDCPDWGGSARGAFISSAMARCQTEGRRTCISSLRRTGPAETLIASCDVVVAKAGYGTACEAMASGTPMIYPPRQGFAEFRSLDRALRAWAGGVPVSTRDFQGLRLEHALERAFEIDPGPPPFPPDGAARIARYLTRLCQHPAKTPCPPETLP